MKYLILIHSNLVTTTLATAPIGPYQLQAAIAAVHGEAARAEDADWAQILGLYDCCTTSRPDRWSRSTALSPSPWFMARGMDLSSLPRPRPTPALAEHHRVEAVRAHLLEMAGDVAAAGAAYRLAARRTLSLPEQRYLDARAAQLAPASRT